MRNISYLIRTGMLIASYVCVRKKMELASECLDLHIHLVNWSFTYKKWFLSWAADKASYKIIFPKDISLKMKSIWALKLGDNFCQLSCRSQNVAEWNILFILLRKMKASKKSWRKHKENFWRFHETKGMHFNINFLYNLYDSVEVKF